MDEIWAIILAAGMSVRMGQQKLLLPWQNTTIIESVIQQIPDDIPNRLVILGSHNEEIKKQIRNLQVKTDINKNYKEGMLSSVICGFNLLPKSAKAAMVFLGDQPGISPDVIHRVKEAWRKSKKPIVIPTFNGRRGHPVLIETKFTDEINQLDGNIGLKQLMNNHASEIYEVPCDDSEILYDIDTPSDYKNALKRMH